MDKKLKQGTYYECLKCGDKIYYDTSRRLVYCRCKAIAVDGWELYCRIIGNQEDYKNIYIDENGRVAKPKPVKY